MDLGIQIEIETKGSPWNAAEILNRFWSDLQRGINAQCQGATGKWLKRNYVSEILIDEHKVLEIGFNLFFNNPGGMCDASSGVTYHMAQLILAHNEEKFAKRLKQTKYILKSNLGNIVDIQSKMDVLYFDYNEKIYGIRLPVRDFSKIDNHLISDSGLEIIFEQLPAKQKKLIKTMAENKSCQCFVCKKIAKNTLKYMTFV